MWCWYCPFSTPRTVCICPSANPLAKKGALQPVMVMLSNKNAVELSIAPKWWFPTLIISVYQHLQGYGCTPRRIFEHGACLAIWQGTGAPHILHFAHLTGPTGGGMPSMAPSHWLGAKRHCGNIEAMHISYSDPCSTQFIHNYMCIMYEVHVRTYVYT